METIQTLTNKMAAALNTLQEEYVTRGGTVAGWEFRGEVATELGYEAPDLIGVLTFESASDEVYGNKTLRLEGYLGGSLRMGARTPAECEAQLQLLAEVISDYLGGLRYTEIGDAVVLQATCDTVTYSGSAVDSCYAWRLGVEAVVQL